MLGYFLHLSLRTWIDFCRLIVPHTHLYNLAVPSLVCLALGIMLLPTDHLQVLLDHFLDQIIERGAELPPELLLRLRGVAEEEFHLSGAEIPRVDLDEDPGLVVCVNSNLIDGTPGSLPLYGGTHEGERLLHHLTYGVRLPCGKDVVIRLVLLQHAPHALDVVLGVAPIALGIDVAQVQALVDALVYPSDGGGDLAGDEGAAATGTLVVEENAVCQVHTVRLAVVDQDPESVLLRDCADREIKREASRKMRADQ